MGIKLKDKKAKKMGRYPKLKIEKKAISPVIATVLLVALVIVIGVIIMMWFQGTVEESITKFGGKNIKLVCGDVEFEASYSSESEKLQISNIGNVPIYSMQMQIDKGYEIKAAILSETEGWPEEGLNQGSIATIDLSTYSLSSGDRVLLTPILLGTSDKGRKTYNCGEYYAKEVLVS